MGRGVPFEGDADPEFSGMRLALGVAGYAIFYLPFAQDDRQYISSIRPWDYDDLRAYQ